MNLIAVVDIDGTVCDSTARIDEITKKYNLDNFGLWQKAHVEEFTKSEYIKHDKIIPGAEILPCLCRTIGAKLIFLTGRSNCGRAATREWLRFNLGIFDSVPLIMREDGDMSGPVDCKINMFKQTILRMYPEKEGKFIFFDDDEKLLLEYSKYGLALRAPQCWETIRFNKEIK